jgi:hypothetical protein
MNLRKADIPTLVRTYREAAISHRDAQLTDPKTANRNAKLAVSIYKELRARGPEAQRALIPLVHDEDVRVRSWAAVDALEFAPGEALPVLEELDKRERVIGLSASIALKNWKTGQFKIS